MRLITASVFALAATPAFAASGPFLSLGNTDFVVLLGLIVFIAILVYFKVPSLLMGMLDGRADGIRNELEEARKLREDAQKLLAGYERQQKEVQEQADRIVADSPGERAAAAEFILEGLHLHKLLFQLAMFGKSAMTSQRASGDFVEVLVTWRVGIVGFLSYLH